MPAVADRIAETTTTTGTGALSLAGALTGFRTFVAGVGGGNVCYYAIVHRTSGEWEVGYGTLTAGVPDTLSRTTVLASSNGNALVNFSTGTKDVFVTAPASRTPLADPVSLITTLLGGLNVPGAVTLSSTLAVDGVVKGLNTGATYTGLIQALGGGSVQLLPDNNGVVAIGITQTSGANVGDLIIGGASAYRVVRKEGTGTFPLMSIGEGNFVQLGVSTARVVATNPANFSATGYIRLRDENGVLQLIPTMLTAW